MGKILERKSNEWRRKLEALVLPLRCNINNQKNLSLVNAEVNIISLSILQETYTKISHHLPNTKNYIYHPEEANKFNLKQNPQHLPVLSGKNWSYINPRRLTFTVKSQKDALFAWLAILSISNYLEEALKSPLSTRYTGEQGCYDV